MNPRTGLEPVRASAEVLERRLVDELGLTDWRALIVIVVAPPGLEQAADRACSSAIAQFGLGEEHVLQWIVRRDGKGRAQLAEYNRARDSLLATKRIVILRAGSAADVRFLRRVAPDLTAAIDVFVELYAEPLTEASWETCSRELRALMADRHATLDFTGLLPASVERRELPLAELYLPLVDDRGRASLFDSGHERGWLVLGHPGTGKTTYLRHLARTYATHADDPLGLGSKVPLLISLSDYGHEREHNRVGSLIEFVPRWLTEQRVTHSSSLTDHLPEVLLLLDGLDELRSPDARQSVLNEVEELLRSGGIGGVVVTGRSFLVDELLDEHLGQDLGQELGLRLRTTRVPTREQVHTFVRGFVRLRQGDDAHADDLLARVDNDPDLRALAQTPLMLAFMVVLDELEGRLPDRRIEIYYRLGEMLVERWTRARSLGASSNHRERPTRADALRVLGPLAWWTVERGGGAVSESAMLREIERIEAQRETADDARRRATALLDLLRADTALLVPLSGYRWSFVHPSIGEYFAAVEAERAPERWESLLADPFRADRREIVLFCAGQLGVIDGRTNSLDQLVDAILTKSRRAGRYDAKYPSLLIGLLVESPGLSREQITRLTKRTLEFVFEAAFATAAKRQVQQEFVALLATAHGTTRAVLAEQLQYRLRDRQASIRWERVLIHEGFSDGSTPESTPGAGRIDASFWAYYMLGPVVRSLDVWASDFGIDLEPTLRRWAAEPEWSYRFARWWVASSAIDRERPIGEVADAIPPEVPAPAKT